jgi:hypothetical protein
VTIAISVSPSQQQLGRRQHDIIHQILEKKEVIPTASKLRREQYEEECEELEREYQENQERILKLAREEA